MIVETHNMMRDPHRIRATRVVVYDEMDNPIAVVVEQDRRVIILSTWEDPDFNDVLHGMGIDRTVVVTQARQIPLPEIHFPASF